MKKLLLNLLLLIIPIFGFTQNHTLKIDSITNIKKGTVVSVPITVKSFTHVINFQGSILWDNAAIQLVSVTNFNPSLGIPNFSNSHKDNYFTYLYSDAVSNHTLKDNEVLFNLNFTVNGNSAIYFSDSPTYVSIDTAADVAGLSDYATIYGIKMNGYVSICKQTYDTIHKVICAKTPFVFNNQALNKAGLYYDTLTNVNGCDSLITLDLKVDSLNLNVLNNNSDSLISLHNNAISYQWIDCDNNNTIINNETNRIFKPIKSGSYAVIVNNSICSDTSSCISFNKITGLESDITSNFASVSPDPVTDKINITLNENINGEVAVLDVNGNTILQESFSGNHISLSTVGIKNGLYFVKINIENKSIAKKISILK